MASTIQKFSKQGIINPPEFVKSCTHYETLMGSVAYGVSSDNSDNDIYGFCIPSKEIVFPHTIGVIDGFDRQVQKFEQWQQHHIVQPGSNHIWDFQVYGIVKYFRLCADCNPNMIDSLYTPVRCVLYMSPIGEMVRSSRKIFLSKKIYHTLKGYAYSQLHKLKIKSPDAGTKRKELVEEFGMDTKFSYHIVRLVNQAEQVLSEGDLDLELTREQLKSIRRGEWTIEQIEDYFRRKEKHLETLYAESKVLPHKIRETEVKKLLIDCLEHHFGSLEKIGNFRPGDSNRKLEEIKRIVLS